MSETQERLTRQHHLFMTVLSSLSSFSPAVPSLPLLGGLLVLASWHDGCMGKSLIPLCLMGSLTWVLEEQPSQVIVSACPEGDLLCVCVCSS